MVPTLGVELRPTHTRVRACCQTHRAGSGASRAEPHSTMYCTLTRGIGTTLHSDRPCEVFTRTASVVAELEANGSVL